MKKADRRGRTDAVSTQISAFQANSAFVWPERLDLPEDEEKARKALQIADEVYATRAPGDWRPSDASLIAEYSLVTADLEALQIQLSNMGYFSRSYGRGGKQIVVPSPLVDVAHRLSGRRSKLAGVLSLTSTAGLGDPRTIAKNGQLHRDANPQTQIEGVIRIEDLLK
ncbi:MAG: hypothetical protein ABJX32_06185 [Tateyamaria sp.]|uniref:hypothetical protein n=1 Tax=Tateyamaria sp. TaxID=1929288 RepID=UPI00329E5962